MKPTLAALLVLATAASAHAAGGGGWVAADEVVELEAEPSDYALAMAEGDEQALLAAGEAANPATIKKLIARSVRAYERAIKADPEAAEPHWRAANVIFGFFLDCEWSTLCDRNNKKLFRRVIEHWNAFEEKAPKDPRLTDVLFDRAILNTKLATDDSLRAAIADYQALLDRGWPELDESTVLGNLAESHMMLGELDAAIERYREAVQSPGARLTSIFYGLAVAYDRDGQGAKAREIIAAHGDGPFRAWELEVAKGDTFYVPEGEVFYYYGLALQSLGHDTEAIVAWERFIASGAHPEFEPRAQEHLDALKAKAKAK